MDAKRWVNLARTSLYGMLYMLSVGFLFVNTWLNPPNDMVVSRWPLILVAIAAIMICPLWVSYVYRNGRIRDNFRWLMVVAHVYTLVVLGLSAIGWYLFPDNGRWEPLTLILGFTTSWITLLQRGWREEDRILSVFHIKYDDG